jgi:hypothetical protein
LFQTTESMRFFILSILALSLSTGIQAQERKFQLGIIGSSQLSYLNTNMADVETGSALLFGFGGIAEYSFAERYHFTSGFEYLRRGASLTINDTTTKYRAGFIQIPFQIKMRTRQFGYQTYFAEMGFALGFETGEMVEWEPNFDPQLGSLISLFDATFRIGLGVEYDLGGQTKLLGRLQYHRALSDNLIDDQDSRLNEQSVYRFDYVSLSVGILF